MSLCELSEEEKTTAQQKARKAYRKAYMEECLRICCGEKPIWYTLSECRINDNSFITPVLITKDEIYYMDSPSKDPEAFSDMEVHKFLLQNLTSMGVEQKPGSGVCIKFKLEKDNSTFTITSNAILPQSEFKALWHALGSLPSWSVDDNGNVIVDDYHNEELELQQALYDLKKRNRNKQILLAIPKGQVRYPDDDGVLPGQYFTTPILLCEGDNNEAKKVYRHIDFYYSRLDGREVKGVYDRNIESYWQDSSHTVLRINVIFTYAPDEGPVRDFLEFQLTKTEQESFVRLLDEWSIQRTRTVTQNTKSSYDKYKFRSRYLNHCWKCQESIDSERDKHCPKCDMFICSVCGACFCQYPQF